MKDIRPLGYFFGGLLGGACLGWFFRFPPNDSASAATWVQAVAAAVGLGIAIYVPYSQRKEEQREKQLQDKMRRDAALALAVLAINKVIKTAAELKNAVVDGVIPQGRMGSTIDVLTDRRSRFEIIPFEEFTSAEAEAVEEARACVTKLISICQKERKEHVRDEVGHYPIHCEIDMVAQELRRYLLVIKAKT